MASEVRVGVGVFVLYSAREDSTNPRFLIGKRLNSHGAGTYALPGGHLEFGETPEYCAIRELLEETGLDIAEPKFLTATNDYMPTEGKHYITLFMVCVRKSENDVPDVLEPHKCEGWDWVTWKDLLSLMEKENQAQDDDVLERRLFLPLLNLVRQRPGIIPLIP
jgi:8-oxo-dGTP diphosphatase